MPGMPRVGGMVLTNSQYEHHIKKRHASDIGADNAGKFYSSILNSTTSQSSFSLFIQSSISSGIVTYVGPYDRESGALRMHIETPVPIGTTRSGAHSSTLVIGLNPTSAQGVWDIKTAFPYGR